MTLNSLRTVWLFLLSEVQLLPEVLEITFILKMCCIERLKFLTAVPSSALVPILGDWLTLTDIKHLDTAVCVKEKSCRENFIEFIKKYQCLARILFKFKRWLCCDLKLIVWLILRVENIYNLVFENWRIKLSGNTLFEFIKLNNGLYKKHDLVKIFYLVSGIKFSGLHTESKRYLNKLLIVTGRSHLKEFHLTDTIHCDLSETLNTVASSCSSIHTLNITRSRLVLEQSVINVCMECKQLTELNVNGCTNMSTALIECITVHCSNLTSLDIRNCDRIRKNEIMILAYYHRKPLKVLKMSVFLSDFALTMVIEQAGRSLQTLKIGLISSKKQSNAPFITDKSAFKLTAKLCPHLTKLDISNNHSLSVQAILAIGRHFPLLQYLNITSVGYKHMVNGDAEVLDILVKTMPNLQRLHTDYWHSAFKLLYSRLVHFIVSNNTKENHLFKLKRPEIVLILAYLCPTNVCTLSAAVCMKDFTYYSTMSDLVTHYKRLNGK